MSEPNVSTIQGLSAQLDMDRGVTLTVRKERRMWRLKKFYVETFWHHGRQCRGIELHHKLSGRWEIVLSKGTRRETFKAARLAMAKLENPDLQKVIDRLEGKEDHYETFKKQMMGQFQPHTLQRKLAQQQALQAQHAAMQAHLQDSMIYGMGALQVQHPRHHGLIGQVSGGPQAVPPPKPKKPMSFAELRKRILGGK